MRFQIPMDLHWLGVRASTSPVGVTFPAFSVHSIVNIVFSRPGLTVAAGFDTPITVRLEGHVIKMVTDVRYLGVRLNSGLRGGAHLREAMEKAGQAATQIAHHPPKCQRPLLAREESSSVATSIALFGAAACLSKTLESKTNRLLMRRTQRTAALRVIQVYRTVTEAALVLAGTPPWDLMADESRRLWAKGPDTTEEVVRATTLEERLVSPPGRAPVPACGASSPISVLG